MKITIETKSQYESREGQVSISSYSSNDVYFSYSKDPQTNKEVLEGVTFCVKKDDLLPILKALLTPLENN